MSNRPKKTSESRTPPVPGSGVLNKVISIRPAKIPWRRTLGMVATSAICLSMGLLTGNIDWGLWAFLGGFTSLYVQGQPYLPRARVLAGVALGLGLAMGLGSLAISWWAMTLVIGLGSGIATWITGKKEIPLPAGFMFILVGCISAALPVAPHLTWQRVEWVLIGGGIAWVIGMAGWVFHPSKPERMAVRASFDAVANFASQIGTEGSYGAQTMALQSLHNAHRALVSGHRTDQGLERALAYATQIFEQTVELSTRRQLGPIPAKWVNRVRMLGQSIGPRGPASGDICDQSHPSDLHDWQVMVDRAARQMANPAYIAQPYQTHETTTGDTAWFGIVRDGALRMTLAVGASVIIAHVLGRSHPYWVPLTAAAVLQGVTPNLVAQRAIDRAVGTFFGLGLVWLIMGFHPSKPDIMGLALALQFLMLTFIARNYGIAVIFITGLALLIIHAAAAHLALPSLLFARLVDTLIGVAIAVAAGFLLWPQAAGVRIPHLVADALRLEGHVLTTGNFSDVERLTLEHTLWRVRQLATVAVGEPAPAKAHDWSLVVSVERIGYIILALRQIRPKLVPQESRSQWRSSFNVLAEAIHERKPSSAQEVPKTPHLEAVAAELHHMTQTAKEFSP